MRQSVIQFNQFWCISDQVEITERMDDLVISLPTISKDSFENDIRLSLNMLRNLYQQQVDENIQNGDAEERNQNILKDFALSINPRKESKILTSALSVLLSAYIKVIWNRVIAKITCT